MFSPVQQQPSTSVSPQCRDGDLSELIDMLEDDDDEWMNDIDLDEHNKTHLLDNSEDDFDTNAGNSWIFPIGFEKREYQLTISRQCLFNNTLVCLPTGLGKTFIASVVIYNFYRWFPRSKLIFMAHSRPLVNQQIDACYEVVGIPPSESVVLTGKLNKEKRMELWNSKRLFFATPQVIQNDMEEPSFPAQTIRLIIVDEAHKAKGKFAYCEVIKGIHALNQKFRVVALSATPGKTDDVIEVIQNLLISKIEVRSESSIDVQRYTFHKKIDVVRVPLGDIKEIRDRFQQISEPSIRQLIEYKAILPSNINKGHIIFQQKKFLGQSHPQKSEITKLFSVVVSMLHSQDVLERHGIQIFLRSFVDENNKTKLKYYVAQNRELMSMVTELNKTYNAKDPLAIDVHPLPNGEVPSIVDKQLDYGHPKYEILKNRITDYFSHGGNKAIIFCEYRDTVLMVFTLLLQLRPMCRPKMLVGQGGKVSQKDQAAAMSEFRSNTVNVLVTTSVCEEGIDVGEVDLVICFDMSSKNPTRFVQRIGRTGRKRNGNVMILATEGQEETTINSVIGSKDKLNKTIHTNKDIKNSLYKKSPRMIPACFVPVCVETRFSIPTVDIESKPKEKATKAASKKRKTEAAHPPATSIVSHFKRMRKSSIEELETNPVDVIPQEKDVSVTTLPSLQKPSSLKKNLTRDIDTLIQRVSHIEKLPLYLTMMKQIDVAMVMNLSKVFNESSCEDNKENSLDLSFGFSLIRASRSTKTEPKLETVDAESQAVQPVASSESRYGNQFTMPSGPIFPIQSSVFQQNSKSLTKFTSPIPNKFTSPQPGTSAKRKTPQPAKPTFENSPLVRAFQKQRSLSTSTPVTGRAAPIHEPDEQVNLSTASVIGNSSSEATALDFFGLKSIDDLFEGFSEEEEEAEVAVLMPEMTKGKANSPSATPDLYQLNEVIDATLPEISVDPPVLKPFKKCELSITEMFSDDEDSQTELNKNISSPLSDSSQKTEVYEVEDPANLSSPKLLELSKENFDANPSIRVVAQSPSPARPRPNVSKLINALKSSNFLSPSPSTSEKMQSFGFTTKSPTIIPLEMPAICSPMQTREAAWHSQSIPQPVGSPISSRTLNVRKGQRKLAGLNGEASSALPIRKKISKKRKRNSFLETQAAVDGTDSSDDDDSGSLDDFIMNDTCDVTQADEGVDIQAKYLESLRSPSRHAGNFKMPHRPPLVPDVLIYSQVPQADDDWEMDSFVVANDEVEPDSQLDALEIAEQILKQKRRNAHLQRNGIKRRKIVRSIDSSDEDEDLKKLRSEIHSSTDR